MDFKDVIVDVFGEARGALFEAEIQHLIGRGYSQEDLLTFLEKFALSTGIFFTLSMFRRANLTVKDMRRSLAFLFNSFPILEAEFSKYIPQSSRILDFGCGRGLVSCSLALKGFEVHGADTSGEALDVAEGLAHRLQCRVTFHLVKNGEFPFKERYFDMIFSHWTFHEIQEYMQPMIATELSRVLRDKGYIFIIDQEEVASFESIIVLMDQHDVKLESRKKLFPVYDHGKASDAVMLVFRKD